jgi:ABC-type glycerol-3-phosphate transport system substrate-binding protein
MGRLRTVAAIVAALGLAACGGPPESRVTLSDPASAADPSAFVGDWFQPIDGDPSTCA